MNKNKLRTKPIKGLIFFLVIVIILSLACLIYFIIDRSVLVLSIAVYVFCGIFFVLGLIVLCDQLFHYVEIKNDRITNRFLWISHSYPLKKIQKLVLNEEIYYVYVKGRKVCSLPSRIKGSNEIIIYLEQHGIHLSEEDVKR